jgi:enoyl-CoA hydratase
VSDYTEIRCEIDGERATVTLDRPDALNAITPTMLAELNDAFGTLAGSADGPGPAVVVLTGAGRAFSAGVDLKALGERRLEQGKVGDVLDLPARELTSRIGALDAVVVAKVNGPCFTGALELALACDLVVAAAEAPLGDTHAKFGLRPTWGLSQRLPGLVGPQRARLLSFTARSFTGADAAAMGLAALAPPRAELDATVDELVGQITANSRASLAAYKDLFRAGEQRGLADGLAYEASTDYPIDAAESERRLAPWR